MCLCTHVCKCQEKALSGYPMTNYWWVLLLETGMEYRVRVRTVFCSLLDKSLFNLNDFFFTTLDVHLKQLKSCVMRKAQEFKQVMDSCWPRGITVDEEMHVEPGQGYSNVFQTKKQWTASTLQDGFGWQPAEGLGAQEVLKGWRISLSEKLYMILLWFRSLMYLPITCIIQGVW